MAFVRTLVGFFFVFYAANPISGIRARSMRRCFVRVEHNSVVGVDSLVATSFRALWILRDGLMKRPGPTLRVRLRETGSALDMQLVLHKQLAGVCLSCYSEI